MSIFSEAERLLFRAQLDRNVTGIDSIFSDLNDEIAWRGDITHRGGTLPRLFALQADIVDGKTPRHTKSTDQNPPVNQFTPTVELVRQTLQKRFNVTLNHCIMQLYRDGEDHITEHSEKTLDLAEGSCIVNYSAGACREITFRSKVTNASGKREKYVLPLSNDSALFLDLHTNRHYRHAVRRDRRMPDVGPWINMAFRHVATFYRNVNETQIELYGQGAPKNGSQGMTTKELYEAWGRENLTMDWDWETLYGRGYKTDHEIIMDTTRPDTAVLAWSIKSKFIAQNPVVEVKPRSTAPNSTLRVLPPELRVQIFEFCIPLATGLAAHTALFSCMVDSFTPDRLLYNEFKYIYDHRTNCRLCDQDSPSRSQLHNHFYVDHRYNSPYRSCSSCFQMFLNSKDQYKHIKQRDQPNFGCVGCEGLFTCNGLMEHCRTPALIREENTRDGITPCRFIQWLNNNGKMLPAKQKNHRDELGKLEFEFVYKERFWNAHWKDGAKWKRKDIWGIDRPIARPLLTW
jgi:hypothetical protein